ncbi:MAG: DSD1 family PLP-dependent enzyme [Alphaproteobacteria bacterium]|jgi:D-serine deaminase-like pyridoxal phosphate-dependent protein|nr:DSD1 family PLP-dependent enzyme [Alphaproteobacteria bacterium]
MNQPAPAEIGMALEEIETPALIVDLDAFERNLQRMANAVAETPSRLRPHAKTHKCPAVARRQVALGAVGVCCQKVGEAEAMVQGGIRDVLVSNQIVGRRKLGRLVALAREAKLAVCADDAGNVADLAAAAEAGGVTLDVLVEIDVGTHRCGVLPGAPALALAQAIDASANLRFAGLQAYHGRAQHIRDYDERRRAIDRAIELTSETVSLLAEHDLACEIVGGAGTGTYAFEAASGVFNELQAGSYVFMDADYAQNLKADGEFFDEFEHSLFVYATVMSKPAADRAILDAGLKASSVDAGLPRLADLTDASFVRASDEHGVLELGAGAANLGLGTKLRLIPGHCDPTANMYDWYVGIRGDRVETLWPITARGAGA